MAPISPTRSIVGLNHPYFPWIQQMKQFGITSGCTAPTYCPDDPVTRGQMAVFIMRSGFNLLLPANIPVVAWASPASSSTGKAAFVTIVGQNTNFKRCDAGERRLGDYHQQHQCVERDNADRPLRGGPRAPLRGRVRIR